jgi:hypothetical protein
MRSFLQEVVEHLDLSPDRLSGYVFVLPNKRAGSFLKHLLASRFDRPTLAPTIVSIEDFVQEVSDLKVISNTELLFHTYQAYRSLDQLQHKDDLETFSGWITPLLADFNEIDRYCLPADELFLNLGRIKAMERWNIEGEPTSMVESHLQFWEQLPLLYAELQERLLSSGLGYQGLVYRKAAEDIEHYSKAAEIKQKTHVFVGFNALNVAEEVIIQELLNKDMAAVYWDMSAYFLGKKGDGVSLFLSKYLNSWPHFRKNEPLFVHEHYSSDKQVELVEVQKQIGQVHFAAQLLASLSDSELANTAVVLADENLLTPLLHALPANVTQVNVTMGTPLRAAPASSFFEQLLLLKSRSGRNLHHAAVSSILQHPMSRLLIGRPLKIISELNRLNLSYPSSEELVELADQADKYMVEKLFSPWEDIEQAITHCLQLIEFWREKQALGPLLTASLFKLNQVFEQIAELQGQFGLLEKISSLHSLYQELVRMEQLDLEGQPLAGLQIMGLLETRALDFERVIMLSVNEGKLPAGRQGSTYLSHDIKTAFDLPTYDEKDAIFAYHFFRLLFRARTIHLLYNDHSEGISTGEQSRFIRMLRLQQIPTHQITEIKANPALRVSEKKLLTIAKNDSIIRRLADHAASGFSPSALTTYIRNPIDFYQRYILGIREADELEETVAYNTLGTIVHDSLEELYLPLAGEVLEVKGLKGMLEKCNHVVDVQFAHHFRKGDLNTGMNRIIHEVARRYVQKLIELDISVVEAGNSIQLLELEKDLRAELSSNLLPGGVYVKGKADRIDRYNGKLRVIDYKTGKVAPKNLDVTEWESLNTDYEKSKAYQVLLYALLIEADYPGEEMEAGVISFKNFSSGFIPFKFNKDQRIERALLSEFEPVLLALISEICSADIPFTEKEIPKHAY